MLNVKRKALLVFLIALFAGVNFFNRGNFQARADTAAEIQNHLDDLMKQQKDAEAELAAEQAKLYKNQAQIRTTQALIKRIKDEITRLEEELKNLEDRARLNKAMLAEYIRQLYYASQDQDPLVKLTLFQGSLSDMVANFDSTISIKEKIVDALQVINDAKTETEKAKNALAGQQQNQQKALQSQQVQQAEITGNIQETQATLAELKQKLDKLRGELSALLGSSVSADDIVAAAKFASKVTGVRKDYLLGVLVVESNLGRYTGGCNFKQSRMSGTRATIFKGICKELNYDYTKKKVSCPPSGYKGTGGAMGVAQFMPDTWNVYKSSIASVTGHDPPDPWNLVDGVTAMALKLAKVSGVTDHKASAEAKAYCVYLAGANWQAYCDNKGTNYGKLVLYWADNYEQKLNN